MKPLLKAIDYISEYSGRLFAFLCIPVIAVIMLEVIGRYFFNHPFRWTHETMTFLSAFLYLMGGAYILRERGHISVDIVYRLLPVRGRAIMDLVASVFFFLYMTVLLRTGMNFALTSIRIVEKSGTPWNPPIYPLKLFIFITTLLLLIAGIANLIRDLRVVVTGREES
jgi:TRAP-type mannitol/chloroaromatic compound transport system permease small subunit